MKKVLSSLLLASLPLQAFANINFSELSGGPLPNEFRVRGQIRLNLDGKDQIYIQQLESNGTSKTTNFPLPLPTVSRPVNVSPRQITLSKNIYAGERNVSYSLAFSKIGNGDGTMTYAASNSQEVRKYFESDIVSAYGQIARNLHRGSQMIYDPVYRQYSNVICIAVEKKEPTCRANFDITFKKREG